MGKTRKEKNKITSSLFAALKGVHGFDRNILLFLRSITGNCSFSYSPVHNPRGNSPGGAVKRLCGMDAAFDASPAAAGNLYRAVRKTTIFGTTAKKQKDILIKAMHTLQGVLSTTSAYTC